MGKVELLAPAGNFDALKGAVKAGADAVYLGGMQYGARAYADNFTQDEICTGIHLAHVFGRKIYLTVNTLVKGRELDGLYNFLLPLYEKGIDGVIIQDLGVLRYIRQHFPGLALHASTQMTITGSRGAALMKKEGVSRIVPARELSLDEIKKIKTETGLEIETFIHGAMCYCYSGQCLFSSLLGGRSGNRGRCAQPCRLPYIGGGNDKTRGEYYPLSMRDMCTLSILPLLLDAGIDSLKIEGRMKKPAYAAGVTAIYRKYIDLYYENRENVQVSSKDMEILRNLYIRSEMGEGYYRKYNGREMITLHSPAYSETDGKLLEQIENKYLRDELFYFCDAHGVFLPGKRAELTLKKGELSVTCCGDPVQKALNQPLSEEKIKKQLQKTGNSLIRMANMTLETGEDVFLPVRSINELRRNAIAALEEKIICQNGLNYEERKAFTGNSPVNEARKPDRWRAGTCEQEHEKKKAIHVSVMSREQLRAALEQRPERIYLDYSLLEKDVFDKLCRPGCKQGDNQEKKKMGRNWPQLYLTSPFIVREYNDIYLESMREALETGMFTGVLVRNLESFFFFASLLPPERIVLDTGLYLWNRETLAFWEGRAGEFYLPVECNVYEWMELLPYSQKSGLTVSALAYGRLPMMVTANCVKKTLGECEKKPGFVTLTDRYQKQFPVYTDCNSCYNVIYNSVPLSLHKIFAGKISPARHYRLDFTTENFQEALQIIQYFDGILSDYQDPFYKEYTTGHFKKGVE